MHYTYPQSFIIFCSIMKVHSLQHLEPSCYNFLMNKSTHIAVRLSNLRNCQQQPLRKSKKIFLTVRHILMNLHVISSMEFGFLYVHQSFQTSTVLIARSKCSKFITTVSRFIIDLIFNLFLILKKYVFVLSL